MPRRDLLLFALASLAVMLAVVAGGFLALRQVAQKQAEREVRSLAKVLGEGIVAPVVSDDLSSPIRERRLHARRVLDEIVSTEVFNDDRIVRVKIWANDGTILYSDQPELIGSRYVLGDEEMAALRGGPVGAELSDLAKPENRFEKELGKVLEVYLPIKSGPSRRPVLFELYYRFDSVGASAGTLIRELAPTLLGAAAMLLALQFPLALSLARRLQRGREEREQLLQRAIDAGDTERRRIAASLHDNVVQDLAGSAFSIAAIGHRSADSSTRAATEAAAERVRQSLRDLRTLLVEIHPANLRTSGLPAALEDLLSPLRAVGIQTSLDIQDKTPLSHEAEALIFRVAQEAVRNVRVHSQAGSVRVDLVCETPTATLAVVDNGRGFTAEERDKRRGEGHVGLSLAEDVVGHAGGSLRVVSAPGSGTKVLLEVRNP